MDVNESVMQRYSQGARAREESLCCPIDYDRGLLEALPREIVEKDYGCGDPSRYVRPGEVVLDLGSGGGKIAYMAAQLVGAEGRVIGVDMNDDMLALARKYRPEMAERLGGDRVGFVKARIQDLALDLEALADYLAAHPVASVADLEAVRAWEASARTQRPLIPDASVDLVISNCVLNLVEDCDKTQLVREIFRVLRPGGRVAISDIVSDEPVPEALKIDPELWSGCISGAFQEEAFLQAFADAGFAAVTYDKWEAEPWQVVDGIEFRSVTLTAVKPAGGPALDQGHAVIYRGPYAEVRDEQGQVFPRGARIAVSEGGYRLLTEGAYGRDFIGIVPDAEIEPVAFGAQPGTRRPAAETKGARHQAEKDSSGSCCG